MKNFLVDLDAMSEGERELFLEMEREEQAEIERYSSDPVLLERALAYKTAVDQMLEERAEGPAAITFDPGLSENEIEMGFEQFELMGDEVGHGGIHVSPVPFAEVKAAFIQKAVVRNVERWVPAKNLTSKRIYPGNPSPETIGRTHKKKSVAKVEEQLAAAAAGKKKKHPQG